MGNINKQIRNFPSKISQPTPQRLCLNLEIFRIFQYYFNVIRKRSKQLSTFSNEKCPRARDMFSVPRRFRHNFWGLAYQYIVVLPMLSKWSPMSQLSMQNNLLGVLLVGGVCKQQNYAMFTNWRQIYELLGHNSGPKKVLGQLQKVRETHQNATTTRFLLHANN